MLLLLTYDKNMKISTSKKENKLLGETTEINKKDLSYLLID